VTSDGTGLIVGDEEGEAMKKHWLRGLVLGVSVGLLLTGGVALAATSLSVEPWCGVCCDVPVYNGGVEALPESDDFWTMTSSGWGAWDPLTLTLISPGARPPEAIAVSADGSGDMVGRLYFMCWRGDDLVSTSADGFHFAIGWAAHWTEDDYGEWTVELEGPAGKVVDTFYFAEDPSVCEAMDFVPEAGSVMLLGSGLAGLAGYATLRWRTRE
jgi:hypothetical protein